MTAPIDLRASFGSKISEMKDLCKDNHLTIVDTNKDGIFDKNDKSIVFSPFVLFQATVAISGL